MREDVGGGDVIFDVECRIEDEGVEMGIGENKVDVSVEGGRLAMRYE